MIFGINIEHIAIGFFILGLLLIIVAGFTWKNKRPQRISYILFGAGCVCYIIGIIIALIIAK